MAGISSHVLTIFVICAFFATFTINFIYHSSGLYGSHHDKTAVKKSLQAFRGKGDAKGMIISTGKIAFQQQVKKVVQGGNNGSSRRIPTLDCTAYGGPSNEFAQKEMVYWEDIPSDSNFVSPFKKTKGEAQYLTFEPDHG